MAGKAISVSNLPFGTLNEIGVTSWFYEHFEPFSKAVGEYVIGRYEVPKETCLIIESVIFNVLIKDPTPPVALATIPIGQYALLEYLNFFLKFDNTNPMSTTTSYGAFAAPVSGFNPGTRVLDTDMIGPFPSRSLTAPPSTVVTMVAQVTLVIPAALQAMFFVVRSSGRLVSMGRMKQLKQISKAGRE